MTMLVMPMNVVVVIFMLVMAKGVAMVALMVEEADAVGTASLVAVLMPSEPPLWLRVRLPALQSVMCSWARSAIST